MLGISKVEPGLVAHALPTSRARMLDLIPNKTTQLDKTALNQEAALKPNQAACLVWSCHQMTSNEPAGRLLEQNKLEVEAGKLFPPHSTAASGLLPTQTKTQASTK